jgi:uncharacterized membrane protein
MNFDIHPIIVHFPIALLTIYSVIEVLRFKKLNNLPYLFYVKAVLLIVGFLGAEIALATGEVAQHLLKSPSLRTLIHTHSTYAGIATFIFGVLAVIYLILWVSKTECWSKALLKQGTGVILQKIQSVAELLYKNIVPICAVLGLIAITITGALGGAIVYGKDIDPIVTFFYNLTVSQ